MAGGGRAAKRGEREALAVEVRRRAEERQRAAAEAPTVFIGTSFDAELGPCPLCMGESRGVKYCFVPMGRIGRDRRRSLPAGEYHRARLSEDLAARAERRMAARRALCHPPGPGGAGGRV